MSEQVKEMQRVQRVFDILHGKAKADLLIKNLQILDVFGETVFAGSLLVDEGEIISQNADETTVQVAEVFDGQGLYAIPGLIDSHIHYESQLAHPVALGDVMVPNGTTTCFVEILDLISSAGEEGLNAARALFKDYEKLPYRLFAFAPGKKVPYETAREILDMDPVIGMGEFDHFSYSKGNKEDLQKIADARARKKFINGHWGLTVLNPVELSFLPAVGVSNNHDVWNAEDIENSIRNGFSTQIKFGVGNVKNLLTPIINRKFPTDNFSLCSDNVSVNHLKYKGHMDFIINLCIEMGMSPIKAIKMGSLNAARQFHMDDKLGSLAPGRFADIVLTDSLSKVKPLYVFKGGQLVAENGKILQSTSISYSSMKTKGIKGCGGITAEDLDITPMETSADGKSVKVYLFDLFGRGHAKFYQEIWLPVENGQIKEEWNGMKLTRISVVQRYPKEGEKRNIINGYFIGVQLDKGAVATSFPAPTPYMVTIGKNSGEMLFALQTIDQYSGACAAVENNKELALMPIEIHGMMCDLSAEDLLKESAAVDKAAESLGHKNTGEPVVNKLLSLFISLHRFNFMD